MINSNSSPLGMAVTPHHLASQSALAVLREGGNAIEAMVAAAATIAVVYPHMNGLGGDGFWLIVPPQGNPIAIDASGAAGSQATLDFYAGEKHIPHRGPKAALTVAGTVGGWQEALKVSAEMGGEQKPLSRLLGDAIRYAADGIPVTASQEAATRAKHHELRHFRSFAQVFLPHGEIPRAGQRFTQPQLADTLSILCEDGLDSFYHGELADSMAADMQKLGMPLTREDLAAYRPQRRIPLRLKHSKGEIFNLAPPTQGLVSLAILGLTDRLPLESMDEGATIHSVVEATKLAFGLRDRFITDPKMMTQDAQSLLDPQYLDALSTRINPHRAADWGQGKGPGDTVWMGVMDSSGLSVSLSKVFITNLAAVWCCPKVACCGKTGVPLSASTPTICWRWPPANNRSTRLTQPLRVCSTDAPWCMARWAATVSHKRRRRCLFATWCKANRYNRRSVHRAGY